MKTKKADEMEEMVEFDSAPKDLTVTNAEELPAKSNPILEMSASAPVPGEWEMVSVQMGGEPRSPMNGGSEWARSVRRYPIAKGVLYLTETIMRNPDGSYALSQATVFVPA